MRKSRPEGRLPGRPVLLALQLLVLVGFFLLWHVTTATGLLNPFFFGKPWDVLGAPGRTSPGVPSGTIWRSPSPKPCWPSWSVR